MKRGQRIAIWVPLLLSALAPTSASGQGGSSRGGTSVAVEGSVVTITVTIDLVIGGGGNETLPEGAQGVADGIAADIENFWNQGLSRYGSDCLELRLDVVINAIPFSNPPPRILVLPGNLPSTWVTEPGHHVVFWSEGGGFNPGTNSPPPETYDPYDDDGIAPPGEDFGSPFEHEMHATWSDHLETTRDFAHELGHLLGFGDDYEGADALPGREGTLMDHGDLIDQNLVNRLADLARDSGQQLPECWEGPVTGEQTQPGCSPSTVPVTGSLELAVADDGTVTGSVTEKRGAFSCGGTEAPVFENSYQISGTKTAEAFELDVSGTAVTLPIVGTHATVTFNNPGAGGYGATVTYTVDCDTCE